MDLISKEDAVALIKAEMDKIRTHSLVDGTARINLRLAKNIIEDMPTINIVRCKECKHRKKNGFCLEHNRYEKNDNGYCSYGERSSDE